MVEITAKSKFIRTSPRKLRLVARTIKGLPADKALVLLGQINKRAADPLIKTLKSAISNTKAHSETGGNFKIKTIEINGGPIYKRFQPVSRGQSHEIKKRTSHITVVLDDVVTKTEKEGKVGKVGKVDKGEKK